MRGPSKTSTPSRPSSRRSRVFSRVRVDLGARLLLGDLLGRGLLGRSLLGRSLLRRSLLGRSLLGRSLLWQLDADQLGRTLTDRAGLRSDGAERLLGQLDGLVDGGLGAGRRVLEGPLAAQPVQGGLAALDQLVVPAGRGLHVTLGGLAQLLGGEPFAQLGELLGQVVLKLGQPGTPLLDAAA